MAAVTPEQAVAHPNWSMGAKISVDSATMMNKGLELIEAHHLFGLPSDRIDILVHPQSVIHSMVEYVDGSVLAQLGSPDMRIPIAHALAWPERMETPAERLDLARIGIADRSKRRTSTASRRCASPGRRWKQAARRRSSSMPPMRKRSRPSSTAASAFSTLSAPSRRRLLGRTRPRPGPSPKSSTSTGKARALAQELMSEMAA